ncbi:response regulator [Anaerosinus massiliensis]|uniref:response regulator n=1 Tax=Massilibacillus massiliensis TaxID=1806837 RepID=UPI000A47E7AA|nr:response regulator [Massilibacillus massiliensis]
MIRVIIVDDDPMVAELNKRYIELVDGFEVIAVARCADMALEMMESYEVDLILLDIFMPGMNGIELLMKIRKAGKGVDVIVVTAACDQQTIRTALRFGAVDYIIKPFEFERLSEALVNYKELVHMMTEQKIMNQSDLDNYVLGKERLNNSSTPKGIDKNTLKMVWKNVQNFKQIAFSTEEMAESVGVSRVSMRKYLEFMKQLGILKLELIYGTVGRPVYKYRCVCFETQRIARYF